jgi:EAL domain-containing protein (putative c-di-GMP-specific phosphodiesterase class I)
MQTVINARVELEADLRHSLQTHGFTLHYQRQTDSNGDLVGVEALLRWLRPGRQQVSPSVFIPLAEETGLILPLGEWVLEAACRQLVCWSSRPHTAHLTMAVNVSARQFRQPGFVDQVLQVIERTGADPRRIKLELTESLLLANIENTIDTMHALKENGIGFALDDFGTGYSSLAYLKRLPLDQLKIDQSFVRDVLTDPNDAAIARTILGLGHSLGLDVIAEGVETTGQRNFLAQHGCRAFQGFLFGQPVAAEQF